VNGPDGLVEKDTKTHQARRVTLDSATVAVLAAHRERAEYRARLAQVELPPGALLFSRDGLGRSRGIRIRSPDGSIDSASERGSKACGCMISATTWLSPLPRTL
jgi:hypothetical protein